MGRSVLLLATVPLFAGCGTSDVDVRSAEKFQRFPLYWVGRHFERWDLEAVDGLDYPSPIVTFIYGDCTPRGSDEPSCTPPFQIQVSRSCGGPATTGDGARAVYMRGVQVKVYRGEGSRPGLPAKVLRRLRPINEARPPADCGG